MKTELHRELEKHAVFDRSTVAGIVKGESYAGVLLHRLKKSGDILEIERNRYTVHRDPFLVASRISWPSYISIWSALRFHNMTEQLPQTIWTVTTRKRRNTAIDFAGTEIRFITASQRFFFGYDKVNLRGFDVFVADPEKSIIDSLLFRKVSVSEVSSLITDNLRSLRTAKLLDYAIRTGSVPVIKRTGFLLEKAGIPVRKRVAKYLNPPNLPLEYNLPSAEGRLNRDWRILENVAL